MQEGGKVEEGSSVLYFVLLSACFKFLAVPLLISTNEFTTSVSTGKSSALKTSMSSLNASHGLLPSAMGGRGTNSTQSCSNL